jgi:putative tryptophan/tyrosine transport system substrate-binding protein
MQRREFIAFFGGAAATWPLVARAQQSKIPVVGFLNGGSPDGYAPYVKGFLHGLNEAGYVEGKNVTVDYQWARGNYDRLQLMAADLVRRKVAVIAANTPAAPVAKAATSEIPIVFVSTGDPVSVGIVASFNRPGGNVTGVGLLGAELETKRLALLDRLVPGSTPIGVLVNPRNPAASLQLRELQNAAGVIKRQIDIVRASTPSDIDAGFETAAQKGAGALLVVQDPFYNSRREQLVALAARHKRPVIYPLREFAEIGGLFSYGHNLVDGYRQMGVYAARVLKGEKPADIPVVQPTNFEFVINLKTAKTLGLTIPPSLLTTADEVIE